MTADGANGLFRVRLLGEFRAQTVSGPCDLRITGKTLEAFAFLTLYSNRPVRRAGLSSAIWSEQGERRSRANLNTALWRIGRALKAATAGRVSLSLGASQIKLACAPDVFVDALALEDAVRAASQASGGARLSARSREVLMDVLSEDDAPFLGECASEWVLIERERLFNLQIRGLTLLMQDAGEGGRIEDALDFGRRILRMDPMRECVQRQVMWLHVLSGHQANALRQYRDCARVLEKELGVAPMAETRALYEFILSQSRAPAQAAPHGSVRRDRAPGDYDTDLDQLRGLMTRLNSQRRSVFSALSDDRPG